MRRAWVATSMRGMALRRTLETLTIGEQVNEQLYRSTIGSGSVTPAYDVATHDRLDPWRPVKPLPRLRRIFAPAT